MCDIDNDSGGDITAVNAGTGPTGSGQAGAVTLNVSFSGPGTAVNAARSDHAHEASGASNTRIGEGALSSAQGVGNTAVGASALAVNGVAFGNTAVGSNALRDNTSGDSNTAVGQNALFLNTTTPDNTAVGHAAGFQGGSRNTAIGSGALQFGNASTNLDNTAVGFDALRNADGADNTAVGTQALESLAAGDNNVALGKGAGDNLTSGSSNIYVDHPGVAAESNTIRIGRTPSSTRASSRMAFAP